MQVDEIEQVRKEYLNPSNAAEQKHDGETGARVEQRGATSAAAVEAPVQGGKGGNYSKIKFQTGATAGCSAEDEASPRGKEKAARHKRPGRKH